MIKLTTREELNKIAANVETSAGEEKNEYAGYFTLIENPHNNKRLICAVYKTRNIKTQRKFYIIKYRDSTDDLEQEFKTRSQDREELINTLYKLALKNLKNYTQMTERDDTNDDKSC